MKALTLTGTGGLEHLALGDIPAPPPPGPGEAMVRIHSAALNRLDLFVADGLPGQRLTFPHVVGSDGAGVVESVGVGVLGIAPGDRVMINPGIVCGHCAACLEGEESLCSTFRVLGEHRGGTVAEYVVLPAVNLALVPGHMPWAEAAAFTLATLTAWRMLTTRARLGAGETVLIWGIGGGVGMAAAGRRAPRRTGHRDQRLRCQAGSGSAMGAAETINHATTDVHAEVRRLTGGLGADVVVDSVGEQSWQKSPARSGGEDAS